MYYKEEVNGGLKVCDGETLMIWTQGRAHKEAMFNLRHQESRVGGTNFPQ